MRKITETLSKEVVAAAEGEIVGIVTNAYVDPKLTRIRGYKVSSEDRDTGRLLPLRKLLGEKEAMIVRCDGALSETALTDCPLGVKVFDTLGAYCGTLRDLIYDEQTGVVLSLVADDGEISAGKVLTFGKSAVVLRAPTHERVTFRKHSAHHGARRKAPSEPRPLSPVTEAETIPVASSEAETASELFSGEYSFLVGRTVLKNILAERDILAREGERVTPDLIVKARERGKLVELTVNSRKG